jgi:hypothetical protein
MKVQTKDLQVGKQYWLDNSKQVSGIVTNLDVENNTVYFKPVPNQPQRYVRKRGLITFPVNVSYEYLQVEV